MLCIIYDHRREYSCFLSFYFHFILFYFDFSFCSFLSVPLQKVYIEWYHCEYTCRCCELHWDVVDSRNKRGGVATSSNDPTGEVDEGPEVDTATLTTDFSRPYILELYIFSGLAILAEKFSCEVKVRIREIRWKWKKKF